VRKVGSNNNFFYIINADCLLVLCAEANKANWIILFILALFFILGRIIHAYAFIFNQQHFKFRVRGMFLTFSVLISLAVLNIILVLKLTNQT
jgi:uncharacterized protein